MKEVKEKMKVIVEKTDTGFSAFASEVDVYTTGKTITELQNNILEALNFYFEDENIKVGPDDIDLEIDLKQFFQYYRVINSRYLAQRIGMNPTLLSQYVQGRKRPSSLQTNKILDGIHQIGQELVELKLINH